MSTVSVIGAAVVDVYAAPVDKGIFDKASVPARNIGLSCGGDALNEAVILSDLGVNTELISLLGDDETSGIILRCLKARGVDSIKVTKDRDISTGMNIVLVDDKGERYFITNPESSLRKLSRKHIFPYIDSMGDIVSFASIFVSPMLTIRDMEDVFKAVKSKPGRILVADMTTAKNGETVEDIEPLLKYVDYLIPNEKEAYVLTGEKDPVKSASFLLASGANTVIIKCGKDGCIYKSFFEEGKVKAYSDARVIDTTGAGDSFVAGFISALSKGMNLKECCRYGCAVSSLVVEHMGTQCINDMKNEADRRYESLLRNE